MVGLVEVDEIAIIISIHVMIFYLLQGIITKLVFLHEKYILRKTTYSWN